MKTTMAISVETRKAIETYIELNEKFKGSYFWRSPQSANQRRDMERKNSFEYEGDNIKLSFNVSCSAKNIYITKSILINGEVKTVRSLKPFIS